MTYGLKQLALLATSAFFSLPAFAGQCEKLDRVPPSAQQVRAETLAVPRTDILSKGWVFESSASKTYVRLAPGESHGLWSMYYAFAGGNPFCVAGGATESELPAIYLLEYASTTKPIKIHLTLTPGTNVLMTLYSDGVLASAPDRPAQPDKVGVPVELFILEGAELANDAEKHFSAAAEIWAKAGIVLQKKRTRRLSKAESEKLLAQGKELVLDTYRGCPSRFEGPGYSEREQLFKLKSKPDAVAVFFVATRTQSQAEREFLQVYMDNNPMGAPLGRTLAHELGHLFLGEGHTGGEQRTGPCDRFAAGLTIQPKRPAPWTSGLMREGNASNATDISAADAATARQNALGYAGAVYW
jgi:hypothetical protein